MPCPARRLSGGPLDSRHWGEAVQLPPPELARLLGVYAPG
ncbi:hypothetical protein STRIP9103_09481 [Streptomyces ipomoeae 91-03]|uniref:Uncharacterized protein n=1 Tax=Streptomyces ipomoeae 91-03 TaxID=698759 RepID=L1L5X5_9ACTN|nr:hypothetical protein STRIP9103_09481 [Streptomyces ipomoeae 91-03]